MFLRSAAVATTIALLAPSLAAQVPFNVQQYGTTCGPVASAVVTPQGGNYRFSLTVDQAAAQEHVLVIVGINETAVPINFGMNCLLLTELVYTELHRTNAMGTYTWSHTIPTDFTFARFQFAETNFCLQCGTLTVRTSNGLFLERTT